MIINISTNAGNLGKSLEVIPDEINDLLQDEIQKAVRATLAYGENRAREKLHTSQADYLNGLDTHTEGHTYYITLDGDFANAIEDGFPGYNMIQGLVNGPNSKVSKKGVRYNTVPLRIQPYSKSAFSSSEAGKRQVGIRKAALKLIKERGITKTQLNPNGTLKIGYFDAKAGKFKGQVAARLKNTGNKYLEGLTKIQYPYQKAIQSYYMTFRRVSENTSKDKWNHPGYPDGAKIFPEMADYLNREIDNIIEKLDLG